MRRALVAVSLLLALPSFAQDAGAAADPVPAAEAPKPADPAAEVDALWSKRDDAPTQKAIEEKLSTALKAAPNDYGLLWRMARLKAWQADSFTGDKKGALGKESWEWAEKAIKVNGAGKEGHYFAGMGLGLYSQGAGILKALSEGLEGKFNERVDKAMKIGPDLESGGPTLLKARYHYELPWPKRDLGQSAKLFNGLLAKYPQNMRARLFLAETLLKDGEAKKAKEVLEPVFSGSVAYDPPEGRRIQQWAKPVMKQIEEELK